MVKNEDSIQLQVENWEFRIRYIKLEKHINSCTETPQSVLGLGIHFYLRRESVKCSTFQVTEGLQYSNCCKRPAAAAITLILDTGHSSWKITSKFPKVIRTAIIITTETAMTTILRLEGNGINHHSVPNNDNVSHSNHS